MTIINLNISEREVEEVQEETTGNWWDAAVDAYKQDVRGRCKDHTEALNTLFEVCFGMKLVASAPVIRMEHEAGPVYFYSDLYALFGVTAKIYPERKVFSLFVSDPIEDTVEAGRSMLHIRRWSSRPDPLLLIPERVFEYLHSMAAFAGLDYETAHSE